EPEPIPGLPSRPPPGEEILWQGRPRWQGLARTTFHVRLFGAYFLVLAVARGVTTGSIAGFVSALPLAAAGVGLPVLLAVVLARATVYTITTRRVVLRIGVALPIAFNLPFKRIAAASLLARDGGEGDIALQLAGDDRIGWLHLWPHVRPWRFSRAQPTLRSIPD